MKQKLPYFLHSVGVFQHYLGYAYFIRAVELVVQEPDLLQNLQKGLYTRIAAEFDTKTENVERNIRTIRNIMMKNGGEELLVQMSGCRSWSHQMPYPREIIAIFSGYFRNRKEYGT